MGAGRLEEEELLALLLGQGTAGLGVERLAKRILESCEGLQGLAEMEVEELCSLPGLGMAQASRILAAFELGRRARRRGADVSEVVRDPALAAQRFQGQLGDRLREEFHALLLDTKNRVLGHRLISIGSLQASIVHPREVFRPAIRCAAASLIVAHNHPSGDPQPSGEDREITKRLEDCGKIIGIPLLDHLILGRNCFYSFQEKRVRHCAW
jgi:DNA repair protein RadC